MTRFQPNITNNSPHLVLGCVGVGIYQRDHRRDYLLVFFLRHPKFAALCSPLYSLQHTAKKMVEEQPK